MFLRRRHIRLLLNQQRRYLVTATSKKKMPTCNRPDGATIYYEKKGHGSITVLLVAPGGMNSAIPKWEMMSYNPWTQLPESEFTIIGMDQRNADSNRSTGPVGEGWDTYAEDILAVLDECKVEKVLAMGSCIGPSYIFKCMELAPERFLGAVLMQPIGFAHATVENEKWEGSNDRFTAGWFNGWRYNMISEKRSDENEMNKLWGNMFKDKKFVFSVSPEFVQNCQAPLLVLMGYDHYHPALTSQQIAYLSPNAQINMNWWNRKNVPFTKNQVETFFNNNSGGITGSRM